MKSGVYKIINITNNKLYIGSSTDVKYRLSRHKHELRKNKHDNIYLQNAWNKYGEDCFKFEVMLYCEKEYLVKKEQEMIDYYQSTWQNKGYNICAIAGNCLGIKRSKEFKDNMKGNTNNKGRKEYHTSEETKQKQRKAKLGKPSGMLGKHHSEETKLKMSIIRKGKSPSNKGKKCSEETKIKISFSNKGKVSPMKGKHHSEETRKKISENQKGRVAWNKGKTTSKETRLKQSKSRMGKIPWNKGKKLKKK
jgi:group I intron endonuclease